MPSWMANVFKHWLQKRGESPATPADEAPEAAAAVEPGPDETRADVELTITRARLDGFAAALVGEHGLGVGPVSPAGLTVAFAGAIDRAGGRGSPSVSRSPAGVYTPEYWRFRIEAADAAARALLDRAGKAGRVA